MRWGTLPYVFALVPVAAGQDWSNEFGNAHRNGRTGVVGPEFPVPRWTSPVRSSIIARPIVTEGTRAFAVRQTGFPPEPNSDLSPVVAFDVTTGQKLWARSTPFQAGDWTTSIAGGGCP